MTTKITIIIGNPENPEAFESAYPAIATLARALPGVRRFEAAKVWPKEDGSETPAYRTLDLWFDDYDAASAATSTPGAGELFGALFGTGATITGLFSNVEGE